MKKNDVETAEYIRFSVAGNRYSLAFSFLLEVGDPVPVAPLPFSENYVDGLVNINGQMMLQLDVGMLLDSGKPSTKNALLIIDVEGELFALAVDSLDEPIMLKSADIQKAQPKHYGELVLQTLPEHQIIEPTQLKRLFSVSRILHSTNNSAIFQHDWQDEVQENEYEFLQFRINNTTFAVALTDLLEIFDIDTMQNVTQSPNFVVGVSLLRGQPRLLLDLAKLLQLDTPNTGRSALMVAYQGYVLGLMIDEALGVLKVTESNLRFDDEKMLTAINHQDKPIEVLDLKALLTLSIMQQLKPFLTLSKNQQEQHIVYKEMIIINVAGETLAVPLEHASRISYQGALSILPEAKGCVYATMEFQGGVIPVLDLPKILGLQQEATENLEYLIVLCEGQHWALKIEQSLRIIEVPENTINYTEDSSGCLLGFFETDNNLLAVLNIEAICLVDELNTLALSQ